MSLDDGSGTVTQTETDGAGRFQLDDLPPGLVTLSVEAKGFQPLHLAVDVTPPIEPLHLSLRVLIEETVDVRDVPSALSAEPNRNLSSYILTGRDLMDLPRSQDQLMRRLAELAGFTGRPEALSVYVDGFALRRRLPPLEAVDMIRVGANSFDARYAEPGQQRIEIITKPGSSEVYGEISTGFTDETLNATSPFEFDKPAQQNRNVSGYLSGPVLADRLGVMVYGGRWEEDENAAVFASALEPLSLQPVQVAETVPTPVRSDSVSVKVDSRASASRRVSVGYERNTATSQNLGLDGGLDLPERSYNSASSDDAVQVLVTSFGENSVNEIRLEITRGVAETVAAVSSPAILVLDAFNGGGAQSALAQRDTLFNFSLGDEHTWSQGAHTLKAGGTLLWQGQRSVDRSNFGGTFLFGTDFERDPAGGVIFDPVGGQLAISSLERYRRTLLGVPGYGPSQFTQNRGDPLVDVGQWSANTYVQDDWRLSPKVTLSLGVRYDLQADVADGQNVAPRLSLAWLADEEETSTIRLGWGLFYTPVGMDLEFTQIQFDEDHQQQLTVGQPDFFLNIPTQVSGELALSSVSYLKATDLRVPYAIDSSITYERRLSENVLASMGYSWMGGRDLLRLRNINAPLAADGDRLDPAAGPIL